MSHKDRKREKKMQKLREKAERARLKKEGPRVISKRTIHRKIFIIVLAIEDDIDEIASKSIQRLQI